MKALSFEIYHPDLIKWLIHELPIQSKFEAARKLIDSENISFELFDM